MEDTTIRRSVARDFFLHFAATAALYVSAVSFLTLLFDYIDRFFPSGLSYYYDVYSGTMRFAIASLIVIFPLYYFLMRKVMREMRAGTLNPQGSIRKWLLYITLFISGATVVGDLVVLIYTFLGGQEITASFLLKVLAIFVVIGGAFLYYLKDLSGYWLSREQTSKQIGYGVAAVVLVAVAGAFFIIGSPQTQRELRYDQERVGHLSELQMQIVYYWQSKEVLPPALESLEDDISGYRVPVDPATAEAYEYRSTGEMSFELCAEFARPTPEALRESRALYPMSDDAFVHEAGRQCFERTIDPERYPPFEDRISDTKPVTPVLR